MADEPRVPEPLVSYRAMFDAEVEQAKTELRRPWVALLSSGVVAGASVGTSVMLLALVADAALEGIAFRLLLGGAYAVGFTIAILGRTDLFTEYTTIAIFPVLTRDSTIGELARLWGLVYAGNLAGGFCLALLAAELAPALGVADRNSFVHLAKHLVEHRWHTVFLSASLAGWLMGLLSWLIAGGRDTTSQIIFIWLIGMVIGVLGLHHAITGSVEMFAAILSSPEMSWRNALRVLVWTTLGNAVGGAIFALLVRQGVRMQPSARHTSTDRWEGRRSRRHATDEQ